VLKKTKELIHIRNQAHNLTTISPMHRQVYRESPMSPKLAIEQPINCLTSIVALRTTLEKTTL
jgi:hypothetical protein